MIIAVFVVVIFVVRDDCIARSCSIPAPFVFIFKSIGLQPLLCHECDDQAAQSKIHHQRTCYFQTQHISGSQASGVGVRSLCELIVLLFLFCPSSTVRIFKFIVYSLFDA